MKNYIYSLFHFKFIDRIVKNKREKFFNFILSQIDFKNTYSYLDIGTTEDNKSESSNYLNKKFDFIPSHKSISDQKIINKRFSKTLKKSISEKFSENEINEFASDFVISNATIEHVGSRENQITMLENMIKLSNDYLVIQTVNRYFPIETHTKLPLIHFLPKKIYRKIYQMIGFNYYSQEKNLNLMSYSDIKLILLNFKSKIDFSIHKIYTFGFVSNFLVICKKKIV